MFLSSVFSFFYRYGQYNCTAASLGIAKIKKTGENDEKSEDDNASDTELENQRL